MRPGTVAGQGCHAVAHKDDRQEAVATWSLLAAVAWLERHLERRRSRRALLCMTDAQLKDIGLSRSTAYSEASRAFWD